MSTSSLSSGVPESGLLAGRDAAGQVAAVQRVFRLRSRHARGRHDEIQSRRGRERQSIGIVGAPLVEKIVHLDDIRTIGRGGEVQAADRDENASFARANSWPGRVVDNHDRGSSCESIRRAKASSRTRCPFLAENLKKSARSGRTVALTVDSSGTSCGRRQLVGRIAIDNFVQRADGKRPRIRNASRAGGANFVKPWRHGAGDRNGELIRERAGSLVDRRSHDFLHGRQAGMRKHQRRGIVQIVPPSDTSTVAPCFPPAGKTLVSWAPSIGLSAPADAAQCKPFRQ